MSASTMVVWRELENIRDGHLLNTSIRWFLPSTTVFPRGISFTAAKDEVRDKHISPEQYGSIIPPPMHRYLTLRVVYPSGEVCISILHPPEDDKYGYESAAERWNPVQTPETILLSVISMLSSPNDESPANIEAARLWRDDPKEFKKRVRKCVRESVGDE